ncbi:non-homologous end-joining DNA ligase [Sciscionella sediminilitoris]|uniref:non-homologous end-joining DNA ligase n=1 Tax=Sciscionella sediminilitoris TaxID=1445613 RepID=UPI0004DEEFD1|nr:non-homologous end-joining DNA ligase [Sciscionella sp. SE31]
MLAVLTSQRFSDKAWIYERKLDGVRAIGVRDGARVRLWSRSGQALDRVFPEVVAALRATESPCFVVDGEIVAAGRNRGFGTLQKRLGLTDPARIAATGVAVSYYLFDLLHWQRHDVRGLAQRQRKQLLSAAFGFGGVLRYSAHRNTEGERFYAEACRRGWEGLIAKRAGSPYQAGRSHDWLKFKCAFGQEFVVGGFTEPSGARAEFGALLLGYHRSGRLRYAGKVGTGFTAATLRSLGAMLRQCQTEVSPFADRIPERDCHWVRPRLVVQIEFSEWTRDGRLRHPRYTGLRTDKDAADVVREQL